MYKVFLNDRRITLIPKDQHGTQLLEDEIFEVESNEVMKEIINLFLKQEKENIVISGLRLENIWETFRSFFENIKAAGGVVKKEQSLLFIYKRGKWDLPKGKIDQGETPKQAAIREVMEECGIRPDRITKSLPVTWHLYQSPYNERKGQWILKETCWFEMEYSGNERPRPEKGEDIEKTNWIKTGELERIYPHTYPSIVEMLKNYL